MIGVFNSGPRYSDSYRDFGKQPVRRTESGQPRESRWSPDDEEEEESGRVKKRGIRRHRASPEILGINTPRK